MTTLKWSILLNSSRRTLPGVSTTLSQSLTFIISLLMPKRTNTPCLMWQGSNCKNSINNNILPSRICLLLRTCIKCQWAWHRSGPTSALKISLWLQTLRILLWACSTQPQCNSNKTTYQTLSKILKLTKMTTLTTNKKMNKPSSNSSYKCSRWIIKWVRLHRDACRKQQWRKANLE